MPTIALADGGAGGPRGGGGAGGTDSATGNGNPGVVGGFSAGGGGGGAGANGGSGGNGAAAGGTAPGADGANGATDSAGGGGGAHGFVGAALPNAAVLGGSGGAGANGSSALGIDAGGGGAGGWGAVVTGTGTLNALGAGNTVTGGQGGAGGNGVSIVSGGDGGSGGIGLSLQGAAPILTINAAVIGGAGGAGGTASGGTGSNGDGAAGGVGIAGNAAVLTIMSDVTGGAGGAGGNNALLEGAGTGGKGGAGVTLFGGSVINQATIMGGNGGTGGTGGTGHGPGAGGVGIVGTGLTINNTGNIIGGRANGGAGAQNFAIQFNGGTNVVGGAGTIAGGINVAAGSFQPALPGSAFGPLAISGPLVFGAGSIYNVRITPAATDSIIATGGATLTGASVVVNAGAGTYAARQYTILTATGGLGGTSFSGVTSNLAFLTPTLTYDANHVFLNIQAGTSTAPPVVANNGTLVPNYATAASTRNQYSVASGLTNAGIVNGGTGPILTAFNQLTVPQAQAAFDSISGEGIAAAQNAANLSSQMFMSAIFDQTAFYGSGSPANSITLTDAPSGALGYAARASDFSAYSPIKVHDPSPSPYQAQRTWRIWASGFGGSETLNGNAATGSAAQADTIYGGLIGVDYQVMPGYLAGIAAGGSDGSFSVAGRSTSGSTAGGHIAVYSLATFGSFYGASSTSASFYTNQTTRNIAGFGGLTSETERGNFDSHEFRSRLEFGRYFDAFGMTVTPFAALELAELRSNGFNETAVTGPGLLALNVSGQSSSSVPAFAGVRFQGAAPLGNGMLLAPTVQLAYVHEFAPQRNEIAGLINLPGSAFLVDGARSSRDAAQVKAGFQLALNAQSAFFANFDGEFSGTSQYYGGKGGFKYVW